MKKVLSYGIIVFVALLIGFLLVESYRKRPKLMDERISLRQKDKIPYGFFAVRELVPSLFPNATFYTDKHAPGYWDSLSVTKSNQAVVLVAKTLQADNDELDRLLEFVHKGNYAFIITKFMSYEANSIFGFNNGDIYSEDGLQDGSTDSLKVKLAFPRFDDTLIYTYPGRRHAAHFRNWQKEKVIVLGSNVYGYPNFIQFKVGKGSVFIHTAPLAFSNYFVLHKSNIRYLEQAFSVIPSSVEKIAWSEYYLSKQTTRPQKEPDLLNVLFRYPSFKWAFLTAIAAFLLYVLMEMRRKQRIIPVIQKPRNDSLDFVQTIGRLYYDKKDHGNLARKMSSYYLDHIRTRYKLPTNMLDESFLHALHAKSGYEMNKLKSITDFIDYISTASNITESQLTDFYNQLESFYQNT